MEKQTTTWDAVMKRNSNLPSPNSSPKRNAGGSTDKTSRRDLGQQLNDALTPEEPAGAFGGYDPRLELQDPCNDQAGWMDFLQILVHQHAKTIVTLQDLTQEVEKLKDFRSSFISSITGELSKSSAGPSVSGTHLHHGGSKQDVWTSSPNKLIDSGFSTETKESNPQKSTDDDPLYSLLDLIQTKVSSTASASSPSCTCGPVKNGTRAAANTLGKLDSILGFKAGIEENVHLEKPLIKAILREVDSVELQRQVLFAAAKIKTLESHLASLSHEENTTSRLASKYLALSHENEQLRFKLKEQEIQLEGTKARLRILEKNHSAAAATLSLSSILKPTGHGHGPLSTTALPAAVVTPEPYPRLHRPVHSSSASPRRSPSTGPAEAPAPISTVRLEPQPDISQLSLSSAPSNYTTCSAISSSPILHDNVRVKVSKCPIETPPPSKASEKQHIIDNKTSSRLQSDTNTLNTINSKKHSALLHEHPTAVVRSISRTGTIQPPRPPGAPRPVSTRLPTARKLHPSSPRSTASTPSSVSSLSPPPSQSMSKSPGSSISSKASLIPIAVTRLRRNNNPSNMNNTSKKPGSNFWTSWFASGTN